MNKYDDYPKVWYPANEKQGVSKAVVGHLLWKGKLLCGASIGATITKAGCTTARAYMAAIPENPMCKSCEREYKENPNFPWYKWSHGIAERSTT